MRLFQTDKIESSSTLTSLSALDRSSLAVQVYDRLLRAIVRKELALGQQLDVDKLANVFEVSRTPVQAAISRLAGLGLVEVRPRKGSYVASLSAQDIHELFEIQSVIEVYAVRKGAQLSSDRELIKLRELFEGLGEFYSGDQYIDYYAFLEQDRQFHSAVVALARNQRLLRMYNQARTLIEVTRASASRDVGGAACSHEAHMAVVEALMDRDGERAATALEMHAREREQAILARLHLLG